MKKILLKNTRIVNPFGKPVYIENGGIGIAGEKITETGDFRYDESQYDEVVNLKGKMVLPGMINAHTHLYSALALGMPPPRRVTKNFVEILQEIWWKLDLALDKDSVKASFEAGLLECLKWGVTTVFDHHSSPNFTRGSLDLLCEIANRFGINIAVAFELTDRNGENRFQAGLEENLATLKQYSNNLHVHPMMGLHASFTLSDNSLKKIRDTVDKLENGGIHIHAGEDKADQIDAVSRGYSSVIQRLNHFRLLNSKSLIAHGIHITPANVELLKKTGAMLVHNPTSNANNRVGLLATETINSLPAGLGTDGMQANMLAEAKEGMLIRSSHLSGNVENVNYPELLFRNNPKIAGSLFGNKIGRIQPGYQADLAVYDYQPRTEINETNFLSHLLFGLNQPSDVMTRGVFRIRNNTFTGGSEDRINADARTQSEKLWKEMNR